LYFLQDITFVWNQELRAAITPLRSDDFFVPNFSLVSVGMHGDAVVEVVFSDILMIDEIWVGP